MNDKMDENETGSISQREKANPKTAEAFSRQAGWNWTENRGAEINLAQNSNLPAA